MNKLTPDQWKRKKDRLNAEKAIIDTMPMGRARDLITCMHRYRVQHLHEGGDMETYDFRKHLRQVVTQSFTTEQLIEANKLCISKGLEPMEEHTPDLVQVYYYLLDDNNNKLFCGNDRYVNKDILLACPRQQRGATINAFLRHSDPAHRYQVYSLYDYWGHEEIPFE